MAYTICVQLYTVRDAMAQDWKSTLQRVAQIGFTGVEIVYTDQIPAATFNAELVRNKLRVSSAHVGIDFLRNSLDTVIADLKLFGARYVICPWIAPEKRGGAAEWRALKTELEAVGKRCQAAGLQFLYHHHDFELTPVADTNALSILLDESAPGTINAEIDVYWVAYAGMDPVTLLNKYAGRVPCVHLKDMGAGEKRPFAEVGHGTLDIAGIIRTATANGAEFLIVEQDVCPGDPFDSITKSYTWLKQHGY